MNKRIRDLALTASVEYIASSVWAFTDSKLEKFAELIVEECIREIAHKSVELLDTEFAAHYNLRLKKHFGIEE